MRRFQADGCCHRAAGEAAQPAHSTLPALSPGPACGDRRSLLASLIGRRALCLVAAYLLTVHHSLFIFRKSLLTFPVSIFTLL